MIYLIKKLDDIKQIHSIQRAMNISNKDIALHDLLYIEKDAIEKQESRDRIQEGIGDLLHSIISLCDFEGFSVEDTLVKVNAKFSKRMQAVKILTQFDTLYYLRIFRRPVENTQNCLHKKYTIASIEQLLLFDHYGFL